MWVFGWWLMLVPNQQYVGTIALSSCESSSRVPEWNSPCKIKCQAFLHSAWVFLPVSDTQVLPIRISLSIRFWWSTVLAYDYFWRIRSGKVFLLVPALTAPTCSLCERNAWARMQNSSTKIFYALSANLSHPEPPSPRNQTQARSQCLRILPGTAPRTSLTRLWLDCDTQLLNSEIADYRFSTLNI